MWAATLNLTRRYLTPENAPTATICRRIFIPDDPRIAAALDEMIALLTNPAIWDDTQGGISAEETAQIVAEMWNEYREDICP